MGDQHYRRGDPEKGCAILVFVAVVIILAVIAVLVWRFLQ